VWFLDGVQELIPMPTNARNAAQTQPTATNNKYDGYSTPTSPAPTILLTSAPPAAPAAQSATVYNASPQSAAVAGVRVVNGALLVAGEPEWGGTSGADRMQGYQRPAAPGTTLTTTGSVAAAALPAPATKAAANLAVPKTTSPESDQGSLTGGNINAYPKPSTTPTVGPVGPSGK
jgi:hypothetical protein